MARNPTHFKFVLVIGRRGEYEDNEVRRSLIQAQERDDFKIITYDSLVENLDHKYSLYVVSRHNEYLDIMSDELCDTGIFSWIDPSQLRVSQQLLANMRAGAPSMHKKIVGRTLVDALTDALGQGESALSALFRFGGWIRPGNGLGAIVGQGKIGAA